MTDPASCHFETRSFKPEFEEHLTTLRDISFACPAKVTVHFGCVPICSGIEALRQGETGVPIPAITTLSIKTGGPIRV